MAALGYIIINVQVEGIPSYYEEQVALVIPNVTQLGLKVPVILGTPTIHWLCRQMKESEIQMAPEESQHALLSYEALRNVSIHAMTPQLNADPGTEYPTNTGQNPIDLDKPVLLKDRVIIPVFASSNSAHPNPENVHERSLLECHGTTPVSGGQGETTRGALHPASLH